MSIFDLSMGKEEKLILEGHDDNVICVNFSFTNKNWKINSSKKRSNNIEREITEESKEQVFTEENIAANSSINKENKERNIIKDSSSNYNNKINTNIINNNNGNSNPELINNKTTKTNIINRNNNDLKINSQLNNIQESVNEYDYSNNYTKSLKKKESNIEIKNNTNTIKTNNNNNDTDTHDYIKAKSSLNYLEYVKFKQDNNIQTNSIINENSLKSNNKDNKDTNDFNNGNLNIMANKINNNTEIIKTSLEKIIKEEFKSMKSFIHEEIKQVHLDMIRQFQLQEMNIINEIRNSVALNHALKKELKLVKKENNEIKNNYFN